jgi:predicted PurR-regulated permease PerM
VTTEPVKVEPVQPAGARPGADLARATLGVFFMAGLAGATLWILKPFVPAFVWATMIVVAIWPLMLRVQAGLNGKRWAAVCVMTVALLLTLVIPLSLAVTAVVSHTEDIGGWAQSLRDLRLPPPPAWVEQLPMVGPRVSRAWNDIVVAAPAELAQKLEPYARDMGRWLIANIGSVGTLIVQFLLTVVISAILFARGESAAAGVRSFFHRLAGVHGENVVLLSSRAIRSVALGVVLTALVQSILGGIGLAIAGVPFAGLLTAIMLVLALAQIGAAPVLIAAVVWLYWTRDSAWVPTALLIWSIFIGAIDNVLRPILIQRSGQLPLLIVFAGVVGGLLGFGLIGIFLGPMVLAVVYTLLKAWVRAGPQWDQSPLVRREPLP